MSIGCSCAKLPKLKCLMYVMKQKTLAARGLEELFCPVVLLCQFLVLAGNRFWFYILTKLINNAQAYLCEVL